MKSSYSKNPMICLVAVLCLSGILFGKTFSIHGKVIDEKGNPIIGANVSLQGTILGSATNTDGEFTITKVPSGNFTLSIYFIGYEKKEMGIRIETEDHDVGYILLNPRAIDSDPVVVTASKYEQPSQDVSVS
ncbi:MAG: hypothetical protein GWN00_29925, partial [Aliifodinibius sp.]|nr:carboxypeptidase-like regulatory domain-containing protein [Fodinibius sp.]NIV15011.1 hypothetical protein [Fodinibius sp.]NIY28857.1 hypothetical protein [Fodinibius sp.]